jgi:hypothetical protein
VAPAVRRGHHPEVAAEHGRPVIKWMETTDGAFEHLLRYPLDELVQMSTTQFWPCLAVPSEIRHDLHGQ